MCFRVLFGRLVARIVGIGVAHELAVDWADGRVAERFVAEFVPN